MEDYVYDYPIEMPTPCQKCGRIFELNTGVCSEKWFPNTIICVECGLDEDREVEEDENIEEANLELNNALFEFRERGWGKITDENQALIIQIVMQAEGDPLPDTDHVKLKDNGFGSLTNALNKLKGNGA